eukprot:jgi/Chrzof1/10412/UNPLg00336.t1
MCVRRHAGTEEVTEVPTHWGIHEDVYCAGKEEVFQFLEQVLTEVIDLFPYQYIHIGGDECPKARWEQCPLCQKRMMEEGLENENELQSWFIKRMSKFLTARGKKFIGWDEILEGGLADGATVMSWRGIMGGVVAAKGGHDVIMTPTSHCYFDYRQAASSSEPGAWYALLPLSTVYEYDPIPGMSPPPQHHLQAAAAAEDDIMPHEPEEQEESGQEQEQDQQQQSQPQQQQNSQQYEQAGQHSQQQVHEAGSTGPSQPDDFNHHHQQQQQQQQQQEQEDPSGHGTADATADVAGGDADTATVVSVPMSPVTTRSQSIAASVEDMEVVGPAANDSNDGVSNMPPLADTSRVDLTRLSPEEESRILGGQANLWTEYVPDATTAEYMLLPRLCAMSEALWSPNSVKNWDGFIERLRPNLELLGHLGYRYRPLD